MAKIIGKTFDHRDTLKMLGAKWDKLGKFWTVADTNESAIAAIRNLSGVFVTADDAPGAADPFPSVQPGTSTNPADYIPAAPEPAERSTPSAVDRLLAALNDTAPPAAPAEPEAEYLDTATLPRVGKSSFIGNDATHYGIVQGGAPKVFAGFASLNDLVSFIKTLPKRNTSAWMEGYMENWIGSKSMDDACRIATNGWRKGVEIANEAASLLTGEHAEARERNYGVAGGRVNVGRMLSGNPLHMSRRDKAPSTKVITLYVSMEAGANISAETLTIRAGAIAAMADMLEMSGYSCEIVSVGFGATPGNHYLHMLTTLKRASEALSINDVIFGLGHASMMRRFQFALIDSHRASRPLWDRYGMPTQAFTPSHLPPVGSYYLTFPNDNPPAGSTFAQKVKFIFNKIVPRNFPIKLTAG